MDPPITLPQFSYLPSGHENIYLGLGVVTRDNAKKASHTVSQVTTSFLAWEMKDDLVPFDLPKQGMGNS